MKCKVLFAFRYGIWCKILHNKSKYRKWYTLRNTSFITVKIENIKKNSNKNQNIYFYCITHIYICMYVNSIYILTYMNNKYFVDEFL